MPTAAVPPSKPGPPPLRPPTDDVEMTFTEHLAELRTRLLITIAAVGITSLAAFPLMPAFLGFVERYFLAGIQLHVFSPAETIRVYIKLSLLIGVVVLPFVLHALMQINQAAGLVDTYQLEPTVGFITLMLGIFAVMFQLPILAAILASVGIINAKMLTDKWRHATLAIFIAAGIAAPDGNPMTMALLALPLLALYVLSIVVVGIAQPKLARQS